MIDNIEESLNGGYNGIYGEVVEYDCYKVKELPFIPNVVFDIGGNVGVFTRFSRELWKDSLIVSVEPHPENIEVFTRFTQKDDKIILLQKAIGQGSVWHGLGALNGSGEIYVSSGLGFYENEMKESERVESVKVETIMLDELYKTYVKPKDKCLIKIDCEGAENIIWGHKPSMEVLKKMDYIAIELHYYALVGGKMYDEMVETTNKTLQGFSDTHDCIFIDNYFFALKKEYGRNENV